MCELNVGDVVEIVSYPPGTICLEKTYGIHIGDTTTITDRQLEIFDGEESAYRVDIDEGLFWWNEDNFILAGTTETVTDEEFSELLQE